MKTGLRSRHEPFLKYSCQSLITGNSQKNELRLQMDDHFKAAEFKEKFSTLRVEGFNPQYFTKDERDNKINA